MRADIDEQQRLWLRPETMTERTALFAWWEALPTELRAELKQRVLPLYEPAAAITATEVRAGPQASIAKGAKTIEPAWLESFRRLAKDVDEYMRAKQAKDQQTWVIKW